MHKGPLVSRFAISTVVLLGLLFSHSAFAAAGSQRANETGSMGPVPKAQCGPSNRTESGLHPHATAYLADSPAGLSPHETNKVNEARGLLGLSQSNGPNFAVYDLNGDCAHPKLASSITVPNSKGHMGGWAEDGKTFYIGQQFRGVGGILPIIDVTNPYNAKWLLNWTFTGDGRPHDVSTNKDGTRLYAGQPGNFGAPANDSSFGPDGLVILDVSDIQLRRPNPHGRERHSVASSQSTHPNCPQALLGRSRARRTDTPLLLPRALVPDQYRRVRRASRRRPSGGGMCPGSVTVRVFECHRHNRRDEP